MQLNARQELRCGRCSGRKCNVSGPESGPNLRQLTKAAKALVVIWYWTVDTECRLCRECVHGRLCSYLRKGRGGESCGRTLPSTTIRRRSAGSLASADDVTNWTRKAPPRGGFSSDVGLHIFRHSTPCNNSNERRVFLYTDSVLSQVLTCSKCPRIIVGGWS